VRPPHAVPALVSEELRQGAGALSGTCRPSLCHASQEKQPTPSVTNKKQRGSLIWQPTLYTMPMKGITVLGHKGMVAYLAGPEYGPKSLRD
jgi:hypothetical protein